MALKQTQIKWDLDVCILTCLRNYQQVFWYLLHKILVLVEICDTTEVGTLGILSIDLVDKRKISKWVCQNNILSHFQSSFWLFPYTKSAGMNSSPLLHFVCKETFLPADSQLYSLNYKEISIRWCCILNLTRVICIEK